MLEFPVRFCTMFSEEPKKDILIFCRQKGMAYLELKLYIFVPFID